MALARAAALVARGWSQAEVRGPASGPSPAWSALVAPFAPGILAGFRARPATGWCWPPPPPRHGRPRSPRPSGFDDVLATRYEVRRGPLHRPPRRRLRVGPGQAAAARRWAGARGRRPGRLPRLLATASSTCRCSASVGHPHAVNPDPAPQRAWPLPGAGRSSTGTGPPGCPRCSGSSPTTCCGPSSGPRPSPTPASTIDRASTTCPGRGPVLLAANHRSYFDVAALAVVAARLGRPVRFLAKRELFDAPVVGLGGPGPRRHPGRPGQPARTSRCARPRRPCGPARW